MSAGVDAVLAAVSAAAGLSVLVSPRGQRTRELPGLVSGGSRGPGRAGTPPPTADADGPAGARVQRERVLRRRAALAVAVVALVASFGPLVGSVGGLVGAVVADRLLDRLEPAARRRRRAVLLEDLPGFADLLAATTGAGVPTARAVGVCAEAIGGPLGLSAGRVARALDLGAEPARAWELLSDEEQTAPLAATMIRSDSRGLAPGAGLRACAVAARRARATAASSRAQAVAVSAAAPLGLCFLPAFVLLAVVPTVAGGLAVLLGG